MNIIKLILLITIAIVVTIAVVLWINNKKVPLSLGVKDGKLAPCPNSPNCVSSQTSSGDHYIEPLSVSGIDHPMEAVASIIRSVPKSEIIVKRDDYIHSIFRSKVFSFIDDVEFYYDKNQGVIHVRSAARVGYSDLGVNRKRMEWIRKQLKESR